MRVSKSLIVAGLAALLLAHGGPAAAANSIREDGRLLVVGDPVSKAHRVLGEPDRVVQLSTRHGGGAGERWEYYHDHKTVQVVISSGRVRAINHVDD